MTLDLSAELQVEGIHAWSIADTFEIGRAHV